MLNMYYQASVYMAFIAIFCFTVVPTMLIQYYLFKDISWDELEIYHLISFLIGIFCAVMSCYLSYTKGGFLC